MLRQDRFASFSDGRMQILQVTLVFLNHQVKEDGAKTYEQLR